jgi:hypothetical protein
MLGRLPDDEAIEAKIDRARSLGLDELRTLWRTTLRSCPPRALTKDLMSRFLCWHIKEQVLGGLDRETAKLLDRLARGDNVGRPRRLKPGTVLVREYQGERHTVSVVAGGYLWRDATVRQPLDDRAGHHRHRLEWSALLRVARRRRSS